MLDDRPALLQIEPQTIRSFELGDLTIWLHGDPVTKIQIGFCCEDLEEARVVSPDELKRLAEFFDRAVKVACP